MAYRYNRILHNNENEQIGSVMAFSSLLEKKKGLER